MSTDSLSFSLLTILMATFWQVTQWTPSFTRPETQVGRSHMIWHFLIGPVTGLETFLKSVTFPFLECSISRTLRWFSDRSWVGGSKQLFSCCSLRLNNLASNVSGWCCSTTDEKANGRQMRYTSMGKATMDQSHSQNGEYKWLHLCWGILQTAYISDVFPLMNTPVKTFAFLYWSTRSNLTLWKFTTFWLNLTPCPSSAVYNSV